MNLAKPRKQSDSSIDTLVKVNINSKAEKANNMTDTDKEPTGDIAVVEKEETTSQADIKASNERIRQMDQLQRKLKAKKTMITKNIKKVETAIESFQKVGAEGATITLIKMEAEEVLKSVEKLKEHETEIESISTSLQNVICESEPNEL